LFERSLVKKLSENEQPPAGHMTRVALIAEKYLLER